MKIDIKQKVRLNLPETNSSSSHSLVIGFDNHLKSKEDVLRELEPYIDDSGILRISSAEFGWDSGKFNTTYEKLQYLMAISCSYYGCNDNDEEAFSDRVKVQKLLGIVERIVKRYTGLREVKFDTSLSGVDHQSVDLYGEIMESNTSIRQFLFSNQSWVFLGNDNSGPELGEHEMSNEECQYGLLTVHIPGSIGNIEFPIMEPATNLTMYDMEDFLRTTEDAYKILLNIVLKVKADGSIDSFSNPTISDQIDFVIKGIPRSSCPDERYFTKHFVMKDKKWYLLWADASVMSNYESLPFVFDEIKDDTREHYFDYDNLPKDKIILVETSLELDAFGDINLL